MKKDFQIISGMCVFVVIFFAALFLFMKRNSNQMAEAIAEEVAIERSHVDRLSGALEKNYRGTLHAEVLADLAEKVARLEDRVRELEEKKVVK